jgi:hypothetical protein
MKDITEDVILGKYKKSSTKEEFGCQVELNHYIWIGIDKKGRYYYGHLDHDQLAKFALLDKKEYEEMLYSKKVNWKQLIPEKKNWINSFMRDENESVGETSR